MNSKTNLFLLLGTSLITLANFNGISQAQKLPYPTPILAISSSPTSIAQKITVKVKAGNSSASGTLISRNGDRYTLGTGSAECAF